MPCRSAMSRNPPAINQSSLLNRKTSSAILELDYPSTKSTQPDRADPVRAVTATGIDGQFRNQMAICQNFTG